MENKKIVAEIDSTLPSSQRFYYVMQSIPNTIIAGIFTLVYIEFFQYGQGLEYGLFFVGQIIYSFINAFNDPLLGRMSDNTNVKRWGSRRLVYIKYWGPFWCLIFYLIWFPWTNDPNNQLIIFIHFICSICAFDMLLTLVIIVWMALLPEMTENIEERNKIQFLGSILGMIGILPVAIAFTIYNYTDLIPFQNTIGILAIICAIIFIIVGTKVKERPELHKKDEKMPPIIDSIKQTLTSRSFSSYTAFKFFNYVNTAMLVPYISAYMYLFSIEDPTTVMIMFSGAFALFGILGQTFYVRMAKKHDMRTLVIRGRIISLIFSLISFILIIQSSGVTEIFIWAFLIINSVIGGYSLFGYPMLMLSTDEDEVNYGVRREGMFLGVNAFFIKFADSVGPIIASGVLLIFGYDAFRDALKIDPSLEPTNVVVFGIKLVLIGIPAIMNLLGLICIYFYPLHGEYLIEMRKKLIELHEEKKNAYISNGSTNIINNSET